jgi:hypothetical protein
MPLDLCSVTYGETRRFSFMSIAMGLMCEVDLGEFAWDMMTHTSC